MDVVSVTEWRITTHIQKDDVGVQRNMNQTRSLPSELVVLGGRSPLCEGFRLSDRLPLELIHRILEYDGRIKYRHGKYMNQIDPDDYRYHLLRKIPVFRWAKWNSGENYDVYRMNYNNNNENHKMLVYILDGSITYLYMNHMNHVCDFYKTIR